jgi:hypothetical protein
MSGGSLGESRNNRCFCGSWVTVFGVDKVGEGLFALARVCLHRLRMEVVGHGDGS